MSISPKTRIWYGTEQRMGCVTKRTHPFLSIAEGNVEGIEVSNMLHMHDDNCYRVNLIYMSQVETASTSGKDIRTENHEGTSSRWPPANHWQADTLSLSKGEGLESDHRLLNHRKSVDRHSGWARLTTTDQTSRDQMGYNNGLSPSPSSSPSLSLSL